MSRYKISCSTKCPLLNERSRHSVEIDTLADILATSMEEVTKTKYFYIVQ